MKKVLSIVTQVCVLCLFIVPGFAQEKPADTNRLVLEKIRADKKLFVAEIMQFTEAEAKAFWPVYESYQKDLAKLFERSAKLIDDYGKSYKSMTDGMAKRLLDELLSIESDRIQLKKDYLPKFRQALSEKMVARYYQLENKTYAVVNYELAGLIPLVE
jgi:uncharacterized membrane-anchored protein YhcB (DUF1043 family)